MSIDWHHRVNGISRNRLLALQANAPLCLHLSPGWTENNIEVRKFLAELEESYIVLTGEGHKQELAQKQLGVNSIFLESALNMKYRPTSIPSITNLVVWDYWCISYPIILELLKRPWLQVDIFAVYFDWGVSPGL